MRPVEQFSRKVLTRLNIIENVGNAENNNAALHAIGTCDVSDSTPQLGSWKSTDCNIDHDGNQGCGVIFPESKLNYGPDFNANGGGVSAIFNTSSHTVH